MEPPNSIYQVPLELLYHCVAGTSGVHRADIPLFGRQCSNLRATCRTLMSRVDICWKTCFEVFWNDWKDTPDFQTMSRKDFVQKMFSSPSLVLNWIEGEPKIFIKNLDGNDEISLNPNIHLWQLQKKIVLPLTRPPTPIYSNDIGVISDGSSYGHALFLNLKTEKTIRRLHGNQKSRLFFTSAIDPIFINKDIYILFRRSMPHIHNVIQIYSGTLEKICLKKTTIILYNHIVAARPLNDHLVFLYNDVHRYKLCAVSFQALSTSDNPDFFHSDVLRSFCKFVEFKNKLVLCSGFGGVEKEFRIQTLDIQDNKFVISDMDIKELANIKFYYIDCAYCHLDKLFIIGGLAANTSIGVLKAQPYIIVIDLTSKKVENKHALTIRNLEEEIRIFSVGLGSVHVFIPEVNNPYTLKFDYDNS